MWIYTRIFLSYFKFSMHKTKIFSFCSSLTPTETTLPLSFSTLVVCWKHHPLSHPSQIWGQIFLSWVFPTLSSLQNHDQVVCTSEICLRCIFSIDLIQFDFILSFYHILVVIATLKSTLYIATRIMFLKCRYDC